jgi:hypothetical protein
VDPHLTYDPVDRLMAHSVPGMAHFAGTGPKGKTCGECAYWMLQRCDKYRQLAHRPGPRNIPFHTSSCKYFVQAQHAKK